MKAAINLFRNGVLGFFFLLLIWQAPSANAVRVINLNNNNEQLNDLFTQVVTALLFGSLDTTQLQFAQGLAANAANGAFILPGLYGGLGGTLGYGAGQFNNGFNSGFNTLDPTNTNFASLQNQVAGGFFDPNGFGFFNNGINTGFFDPRFNNFNNGNNSNRAAVQNNRRGGRRGGRKGFAEHDGQNGRDRQESSRESVCGATSYDNICSEETIAEQSEIRQSVETEQNANFDTVQQAMQRGHADLNGVLSRAATSNSLSNEDKNWYDYYLDSTGANHDIQEPANMAKKAILDVIDSPDFKGNKQLARTKVLNARIMTRPNLNDATETEHFKEACSTTNRVDTMVTCPYHKELGDSLPIFVCGDKLRTAWKASKGDLNKFYAILLGPLIHEVGHLIGSEEGSPFQKDTLKAATCFAKESGQAVDSRFNAEKNADLWKGLGMARVIEQGNTFGLPPDEFVKMTTAPLCGTGGTDADHPMDYERIDHLTKILQLKQGSRERLHCSAMPADQSVCTFNGSERGNL